MLTHEESKAKTLQSPLGHKEMKPIKSSNLKGNKP